MGSLEKRIGSLEGRLEPKPRRSPAQELEREAKVAELKRLAAAVYEKAKHEAEEGYTGSYTRRWQALQELNEHVEKRLS
jgi:hypothetical protein